MALCKGIESISGRKVEFECVYKFVNYSKDCINKCLVSNRFMRKGQVGCYKTELSPDYIDRFKRFIDHELDGSDFRYYELFSTH